MAIVDRHDDYVRELFHLDRFVTLIGFDPISAKGSFSSLLFSIPPSPFFSSFPFSS